MIRENKQSAFLPTSVKEMQELGWEQADVILFSGDAYVDHPSFGTAIIARVLEAEGLQVAVVSQPNWRDDLRDFKKLGEPRLFFAVTAGSMDSMVNHYTAGKRKRSDDAYTPEGRSGQRPDDASIVYCNVLKDIYPEVPIVLGGVEASLRRFAHYDYWKDEVRPSILMESKADLLTYGMSEQPIRDIVKLLDKGVPFSSLTTIAQTAFLIDKIPNHKDWKDINLHSFANNKSDKRIFAQDFKTMEENGNTYQKKRFLQVHDQQTLVVNPSNPPMDTAAIDAVYDLPFTRKPHPRYEGKRIPAFDMIKNSVTTHRGCFGGCSFCAIYSHQGKFISSRSKTSIMAEVDSMVEDKDFKGTISDLGGPSANMYRMAGNDLSQCKSCRRVSCVYPRVCKNLNTDHYPTTELFKTAAAIPKVKHCYVASGIRHDMLIDEKGKALSKDKANYMHQMITQHTSGRLTVAPEHTSENVLKLMRKPSYTYFQAFEKLFKKTVEKAGKKFQLVPYFISAHPGSESEDMAELAVASKTSNLYLEQVQDFTPTPMSLSTTMYYTGINPYTNESVYTAKTREEKVGQKRFFFWYKKEEQRGIREELHRIGRQDLENKLFQSKYKAEEGAGYKGKDKGSSNFKDNDMQRNGKSRVGPKGGGRSRSGGRSSSDSKTSDKPWFKDKSSSDSSSDSRSSDKPWLKSKSSSDFKARASRSRSEGDSSSDSRGSDKSWSKGKPSGDSKGRGSSPRSGRDSSSDSRGTDKPSFKDRPRGDSKARGRFVPSADSAADSKSGDKPWSKDKSRGDAKPRGRSGSAGGSDSRGKDKPRSKGKPSSGPREREMPSFRKKRR